MTAAAAPAVTPPPLEDPTSRLEVHHHPIEHTVLIDETAVVDDGSGPVTIDRGWLRQGLEEPALVFRCSSPIGTPLWFRWDPIRHGWVMSIVTPIVLGRIYEVWRGPGTPGMADFLAQWGHAIAAVARPVVDPDAS